MKLSIFIPMFIIALGTVDSLRADEPNTPTTNENANLWGEENPFQTTPGRGLLQLEYLDLIIEAEANYDHRDADFTTGRPFTTRIRQTNTHWSIRETLGLETSGTLFDERAMHFDLSLTGGLEQEAFQEQAPGIDRSQRSDGGLLEYDASVVLFPQGLFTLTAYSSRQDGRIPRAFLPSLEQWYERDGLEITFNHATFPMRFAIEHTWEELESNTARLIDEERRGADRLTYEGTWHIAPQHEITLNYEYEDRVERYSGTQARFDTRRNLVRLGHVYRFGHDDRSEWRNEIRIEEERGDLARDETDITSRLRLQHTDQLSSYYGFQFRQDHFADLTARVWRGDVGIGYIFNENYDAYAELYGLRENLDRDGDIGELGGVLRFNGRHPTPWGELNGYVSYNPTSLESNNGSTQGVAVNEAVVLRDPLPSYLTRQNVNPFSILVTDRNGRRVYLAGRDYLIVPSRTYTGIVRLPNGRITNGEQVLVSYSYDARRDYRIDRHRVDWRIQHDFEHGFAAYYAGAWQAEDLDNPRFQRFLPRDINRHRLGVTQRRDRWSYGVEYEFNDDSIDPYNAVHLNGDYTFLHKEAFDWTSRASLSRFWFDGSRDLVSRTTTYFTAGTSLRYLLTGNTEANLTANYRYEDDSFYGITNAVDVTGGVDVQLGYFDLRFEVEYDVLDLYSNTGDDVLAFWIKIRRVIPVLNRERS